LNDGYGDSWQFHPTLLFTIPLKTNVIELNPSPKLLVPLFSKDGDILVSSNFGLVISQDLEKWAVRPENGFQFNPCEQGFYSHFSIGFSFLIIK